MWIQTEMCVKCYKHMNYKYNGLVKSWKETYSSYVVWMDHSAHQQYELIIEHF